LSDWLGPQPYGVHQPLVADQGRSPRLLGILATGNPCPPVKDRTSRDCLGLGLLQGLNPGGLEYRQRIESLWEVPHRPRQFTGFRFHPASP
jgi:hypothetical protein